MAVALTAAACASGSDTDSRGGQEARVAAVEEGLLLAVQVEGEAPRTYTIEERMERYHVPGVSIAVVDGGRVVWAKGYGLADTETGVPVTPATLFQAASISKPVGALAVLGLVEEGVLQLDAPVNAALTSWKVPDNEFTADSAVTLRGVLTHSAGLTVWGFPGYARGEELPGNVDVLEGRGNTDPVRVYKVPGTSWQYSGGGYTVMEQVVEDVTRRSFADVVGERVLRPVGMERSTYAQPLPEARWPEAARAHGSDGTELPGEWHTYPEQAAAGLWTTPQELARLSVHLLGILDGTVTDGVVSRAMLEQMLTPHGGGAERYQDVGLGFGLSNNGDARIFSHGGSNAGFKASWITYRDGGQGIAVMTNGDRGSALAAEITRAVSAVYGWPGFRPQVRPRVSPPADVLAALAGAYHVEGQPSVVVELASQGNTLVVRVDGAPRGTLYAESDDVWYDVEDGTEIRFERDESGRVVAAQQSAGLRLLPGAT